MNKHLCILIALLLVAVMVLGVVGCAGDSSPEDSTPAQTTAPKNDDPTPDDPKDNPTDDPTDDPSDDPTNNPIENPTEDPEENKNVGKFESFGVNILGFKNASRVSDGGVWLDWAGAGVEYYINVTEAASAQIYLEAIPYDEFAEEVYCYFNVYVDGELKEIAEIECDAAEETFILVSNLSVGDHVIKLVKITDATVASALIMNPEVVDGEFELREVPAEAIAKSITIEFVGGAEVSGAGLGEDESDDVTKSFAWAVAEQLNVEYQFTAYKDNDLETVATEYTKSAPLRDETVTHKFLTDVDVVVIALDGTKDQYEKVLEVVRKWNDPQTKIIFCGMTAEAVGAINEAIVDAEGVYALDISAADDVATAVANKINEVKNVTIGTPVIGGGAVQDWNN